MGEVVHEKTRTQYCVRGYGRSVGFGDRPAAIVVDFQRGLTEYDKFPLAWNYDEEVKATAQLLAAARRAGAPVIYTVVGYERDGIDGGVLVKKIPGLKDFLIGSEWLDVDQRIPPQEGDYIITKRVQSAFFGTMLGTFLTANRIDTLLVAGCTTSGCVRATVTDSCSHGFHTILVRDCVGDQAPEPHEANLFDMEAKNADVVSLEDALAYMASVEGGVREAPHTPAVMTGGRRRTV